MSYYRTLGRSILARQRAKEIEDEWYAKTLAELVADEQVCSVCRGRGAITLSSGFKVHPGCWGGVTSLHVKSPRAFGREPIVGRVAW
jgi:hypothetical protein